MDPDVKEVMNNFCLSSEGIEGVACSRHSNAFLKDQIGSGKYKLILL